MTKLKLEKATPTVGAEVFDVDVDRLLTDDGLPQVVMEAMEEHGVLLFRAMHIDDESQVKFFSRLGEVVRFPRHRIPEVMVISLDPSNPSAEYFRGNMHWHLDGTSDAIPAKATVLTAHVVSPDGGETEFVSTYAAYADLSQYEKERYANLRVLHSQEPIQRLVHPDPTPEQVADWRARSHEHPLVWTHQSGRRSLVIGQTADYVVGMDRDEGRALLADLNARATARDRVFSHSWSVGDMVVWDNTGTLHRARPYDPASGREMHRTTIVGNEAIQ
jgi:alpha-ketoglutarate-dependent taurine dioxygenase